MLNLFKIFFLVFNFTYSEDLLWRSDALFPPVQISPNFILKKQNQTKNNYAECSGFVFVFFFFCLFQISSKNLVISFISLGIVYN